VDTVSPRRRSEIMSRIKSRDTSPELVVRRFLHRAGLRFRLHRGRLPGRPDLVFASRRVCVFVHGCFWHGCTRCVDGLRAVKSNAAYWTEKVETNKTRDRRNEERLKADGWAVLVIWECQIQVGETLAGLADAIRAAPRR
jgi:DNA mismatch endonuclease (patch repair protein)